MPRKMQAYHIIVYNILKNTIKAKHLKYNCEKYFKQTNVCLFKQSN